MMRNVSDDKNRVSRRIRVESSSSHFANANGAVVGLLDCKYADLAPGRRSKVEDNVSREGDSGLTRYTQRSCVRCTKRTVSTIRHDKFRGRARNVKIALDAVSNFNVTLAVHVDDLFFLLEADNSPRSRSLRANCALREREEMFGNFGRPRRRS